MSTHTSTVTSRIDKARRFEAAIPQAADPDWQTVTAFYAALHWVGAAYEHQHGNPPPKSHLKANTVYGTPGHALPPRVYRLYKDLQSYSEQVRYELDAPVLPEEFETAQEQFEKVRDWAKSILSVP